MSGGTPPEKAKMTDQQQCVTKLLQGTHCVYTDPYKSVLLKVGKHVRCHHMSLYEPYIRVNTPL